MYTVKYTMPCLLTGLFYGVTQLKPGGWSSTVATGLFGSDFYRPDVYLPIEPL